MLIIKHFKAEEFGLGQDSKIGFWTDRNGEQDRKDEPCDKARSTAALEASLFHRIRVQRE